MSHMQLLPMDDAMLASICCTWKASKIQSSCGHKKLPGWRAQVEMPGGARGNTTKRKEFDFPNTTHDIKNTYEPSLIFYYFLRRT